MVFHRQTPIVFFLLLTPLIFSSLSNGASVYELLPQYGLPSGLLPDAVKNFSLSDDGTFSVELYRSCYVQFDYLVYYDAIISGKLKYGSITDLKGIEVKKLFIWLNVDEIKVDLPPSDYIYFQVGLINKKLDVKQFKTVQSCRRSASFREFWERFIEEVATPQHEVTMLLTE